VTQQPPQFGERAEYGANDVCYRHPDRHSFTLCQRCGRTICTACQRQSQVGVLCPDCEQELQPSKSRRGARSVRAASRRAADHETPIVTYAIMIACVVVWVAQYFSSFVTEALWYAPVYSLPMQFEPWRELTSMFTHSPSSIFHILFNMYALWLFGRNLEIMLGRVLYLSIYLISGLGGSVAVLLWGYTSLDALRTPTVGASGAIFGVLIATLVVYRKMNVNVVSLAVLIVINLAIGLLPGANISWQAHLGGLVAGGLAMFLVAHNLGPRRRAARITSVVAVAVVLVALSFSYFVASPLESMVS
jgi:membrane associated rhomboid family serine protease